MRTERVCSRCSYRTTHHLTLCPMCDIPLELHERTWHRVRRDPRVDLSPGVPGRVNHQLDVRATNLSARGARLEHHQPLPPRGQCLISLPLGQQGAPLHLPARVVWSQVHHGEGAPATPGPLYHTGVEFQDLPVQDKWDLTVYLDRLLGTPFDPIPAPA